MHVVWHALLRGQWHVDFDPIGRVAIIVRVLGDHTRSAAILPEDAGIVGGGDTHPERDERAFVELAWAGDDIAVVEDADHASGVFNGTGIEFHAAEADRDGDIVEQWV